MNGGNEGKRMVMVVAEPTRESAAALQYAISHAIMETDELILIQVGNASSWKSTFSTFLKRSTSAAAGAAAVAIDGDHGHSSRGGGDWDHLQAMKLACTFALPKLRVRVERVTMGSKEDKAITILRYCKLFSVDLLIVGQRRNLSNILVG